MKPNLVVAAVLVLLGTNIFTYATARYLTTKDVLTRASERVSAAQEKQRAGTLRPHRTLESEIGMAIRLAGGNYYWWNEALFVWGAGGVLVISGILVTRLKPQAAQKDQ